MTDSERSEPDEGSFSELLRHPGVEEILELRSSFGFMAFHGGNLEEGTDQVATAAARRSGSSLYAVLQPPDLRWHIPSAQFRAAQSPALAAFLDHVEVAVAVHGYGRDGLWTTLLLGGGNRALAAHVAEHLRPALPEYTIVDDLDAIPPELRGVHGENPVNQPRSGGVQLELPPRVRGKSPIWRDHPEGVPIPHTVALIEGLVAAATSFTATAAR